MLNVNKGTMDNNKFLKFYTRHVAPTPWAEDVN